MSSLPQTNAKIATSLKNDLHMGKTETITDFEYAFFHDFEAEHLEKYQTIVVQITSDDASHLTVINPLKNLIVGKKEYLLFLLKKNSTIIDITHNTNQIYRYN